MDGFRLKTTAVVALVIVFVTTGCLATPAETNQTPLPKITFVPQSKTSSFEKPVAPSSSESSPTTSDEVVAIVNGQVISAEAWQRATQLDMVMNRLAHRPLPSPEDTLDRLINEILLLDAKRPNQSFSTTDAEARLQQLQSTWQISEIAVVEALNDAGLSRQDLADRTLHLLAVENVIQQLTADGADLNQWLTQARGQVEVSLYRPISTASLSEPRPVAAGVTPIATTVQPEPTPTDTPLPAPPPDLPIAPYPGSVAPDFTLQTLTDETVTLSQLRGKPTLINFWASWCIPCRSELPVLQATYNTHQNELNFLAISLAESSSAVKPFAEDMGLTFPIFLDSDGQVGNATYQVRGIPTTLFINASGVVVNRHIGPLDQATIDNYLQPILAEQVTTPNVDDGG